MSAACIALTAIVAKAGFLAAFAPAVLKIGVVMADTFEDHPTGKITTLADLAVFIWNLNRVVSTR